MSEDYTQANLLFKVRKAARYVRLYGLSRTLQDQGPVPHEVDGVV